MPRKIAIKIKDLEKLQFTLLEDASENDFLDLNDLLEVDVTNINAFSNDLKTKMEDSIKSKLQKDFEQRLNDALSSQSRENDKDKQLALKVLEDKYKQQLNEKENLLTKKQEQIQSLNSQQELLIQNKINEELQQKEKELQDKYVKQLEHIQVQLNEQKTETAKKDEQIKSLKESQELLIANKVNEKLNEQSKKLEEKYEERLKEIQNQLADQKSQTAKKDEQIKSILENKENEIENRLLKQEKELKISHQQDLASKDALIRELELKNNQFQTLNVKQVGEALEHDVENKLIEMFGNFTEAVKFSKINDSKKMKDADSDSYEGKATKADFLVEFYNPATSQLIGKIVIECKSQESGKGTTKNSDHYKKLEADRKKEEANFAFLVTTLEQHKEFFVMTPQEKEYDKILVLRFPVLGQLLTLFYTYFKRLDEVKSSDALVQKGKEFLDGINNIKEAFISAIGKLDERHKNIIKALDNMRKQVDNLETLIGRMVKIDFENIKKSLERTNALPSLDSIIYLESDDLDQSEISELDKL
ncbi:DUF2130 domain-containing protein [Mycoplasmopsis columboralis]|uniref:Uncharacterized protein conserved in bacteria n=2 Tax=Mycoplasmopsis columboralis TaxID=171282 RepID=A0A449B703_9BACT|nr:DUF2130 domain-containing protein [Mycoplasmopsis columboralis]VEU76362.1 Uncharacterized protein conserved in bacteria [Mycoplasmopsis columboralis]